MERVILFKDPEITEKNLSFDISRGFTVREMEPCKEDLDFDHSEPFCFICGWDFYLKNYGFLKKLKVYEESVIVLYEPDESEDLKEDNFIHDFVRSDRHEFLKRSLWGLRKRILKNIDYKKVQALNRELLSIGVALSAERNNDKLLDDILYKIRQITKADAGSLYLLEKIEDSEEQNMLFKIAHNDSNPSDFTELRMPLNTRSIAGYVAVTSSVLNIPDAYAISPDEPYSFNKNYDIATEYRSKSILTVPMLDHHENTIGVIQLINRKESFGKKLKNFSDIEKFVEPFNSEDERIVLSLASQAAVALENNILYNDIETLFEGFVAASVKAIESRDPTTSGHSSRVAAYSVETAKSINEEAAGFYADTFFTDEQLKELRYAGLLHDFGKVGVREDVLVKAKKLYPLHLELIKYRFGYIRKCMELEHLTSGNDKRYNKLIQEIENAIGVISAANEPSVSFEDAATRLAELEKYNKLTYTDPEGNKVKWLTDEEFEMLSIQKGCLNAHEREEIESHVEHSTEFLKNIPWTSTLKDLPDIARGHHERLDGSGYPDGLSADELSLQSRIMAVADIYDALTASDRPYKKALAPDVALRIIKEEADNNRLDSNVVDVFIDKRIYEIGVDK